MVDQTPATALRARYVFPIVGPPLADAAIIISASPLPATRKKIRKTTPASPLPFTQEGFGARGARILSVGPWEKRATANVGQVVDLGNVAILPGLVNAHTHLEFSDLAAPLGRPGMIFPDWIRAVVAHRRSRTEIERRAAIRQGLAESARTGTKTLGEIATAGWPVDLFFGDAAEATRPAATVFFELLGLSAERTAVNLAAAAEHVRISGSVGLSPHAPYTVRQELVRDAATLSRAARIPLAMHVAESPEEMELLESGRGPLYDLLRDFDVWDSSAIPRGARPLDYLRLLSEADRALVIHGTYLDDEAIRFLAARADRMAVVYCPRTHAYFPHQTYPLAKLLAAGVTVALGTDSRASNPDLNLFEEMRFIAEHHAVAPEKIFELATLGGAKALGRDRDSGSLEPGKSADLTVVSLPNVEADPYELLLDARSTVVAGPGGLHRDDAMSDDAPHPC